MPSRPFINTGVDYPGPFYHQVGSRRTSRLENCYICIFVCFASKAVHIELTLDLTSEAFLNALKRFIARRGKPQNMYSNNDSNFVGAARKLSELHDLFNNNDSKEKNIKFNVDRKINWHFIPAYLPHQGGLWESAVKSAKKHLTRMKIS